MALMCSKQLFLRLLIKHNKNINVLLGPSYQCFFPVVNYSQNESEPSQQKLNKAVVAYLEKSKKYDEFLKEQIQEYELGKKFLAGMMGNKENMSQCEVDKAIEFLFPSGLFNKHARPKLKPPEEVFEKKKSAAFDFSGRPFNFLYYTTKPNYSNMLHDSAKKLQELQLYEQKLKKAGVQKPEKTLILTGEEWLSQKELEKKLIEKISLTEYEKFLEVFTRLAEHPFSYMIGDYIKNYRKKLDSKKSKNFPVALPGKDGIMHNVIQSARKTSRCVVKVSYPGTGKIEINNTGLDYFLSSLARAQPKSINQSSKFNSSSNLQCKINYEILICSRTDGGNPDEDCCVRERLSSHWVGVNPVLGLSSRSCPQVYGNSNQESKSKSQPWRDCFWI